MSNSFRIEVGTDLPHFRLMFSGTTCFYITFGVCSDYQSRGCVFFISVVSALGKVDNDRD